ncbi:hypothetical protein F4779DRAFT_49825 [Xylariaceae sp. FL0662B]|nr:hypothetical protein F4779DRAFT_49825 [Xylariaceae sp. FL0662B]
MPKRSFDTCFAMSATDRLPPAKAQKTERSHEENQERAYIAASRRADRSLEARVQSARMASEIHRRRTGRGLKVSEEIVQKEEMYEEEEDDLPRPYKYLTAHLQTNSPDMNHRVNAYITTQTAMATMARYNEVNRLFSESFPSALAYQNQLNNSVYTPPLMTNGSFSPVQPGSNQPSPSSRTHSISEQSQLSNNERRESTATTTISSPPALTPTSATTEISEPKNTPYQAPSAISNLQIDPQLVQQSTSSIFTSELPNEVKMMANIDMNDPMAMHFLGDTPSPYQMFGQHPSDSTKQDNSTVGNVDGLAFDPSSYDAPVPDEAFFSPIEGSMGFLDIPTEDYSQLGTPGGGPGGEGWESFVDFGSEK